MIRCLALLCAVVVSPALAAARPFDTTSPAIPGGACGEGCEGAKQVRHLRPFALILSGEDGFEVNTDTIRSKVQSGAVLPAYEVSPI
ncbi:hypothetical protein M3484_04755 [Pseudomonas sp. GX19020]|uniref:hypothetical protein n=1 Tax=Pseudomonas sp. GX19020 TaxID=2942277 RepID=UPI0020196886|nr:hypothetical protein [Pseudomonas sp. GX19020]MCL4065872.1 hypothetical protein [Pseudomonas sp. GX19020]